MSGKPTTFGPPRGMRDFYPDDMRLRSAIFSAWSDAAQRFGFEPYDACVVENLDLLKRKSGEEIVDQIYAFQDKSGRDLALRPEMTPTLARMVAARQSSLTFPLRWSTIAQCFRYERMTRGRKREHYQLNLDIVGETSISAEAEVIATAVHALSLLGLGVEQLRVHFSSRALLSEILQELGVDAAHYDATFLALDKRGKVEDSAITELLTKEGLDTQAIERVFNILAVQSLDEAAQLAPADSPACRELRAFVDLLTAYGIADVAHFDISVIRGLSYYTGIVFECFDTNREFRAIFGGGRYDNLLQDVGGKPQTGVGLGFGDVVVAEILAAGDKTALQEQALTAVGFMTDEQQMAAIRAATALRRSNEHVRLSLSPEKPRKFFTRVDKTGAGKAIYIGPDDVASGTVRVKNMTTGTETTMPLGD